MKIFVSGGAGFIGSHLALELLKQGHEVTVFDNLLLGKEEFLIPCRDFKGFNFFRGDLMDSALTQEKIRGHEMVFHLAANSDILEGTKRTDLDLKIGTIATYNILEAMRVEGIKKIIFSSTSAIYGEATVKPTPESYGPLFPISLYGASKLSCEALLSAFSHNFEIQTWIYRFANIVGSHSTHGAIFDFIARLQKDPKNLTVLGDGSQRKSYLHVKDCVQGMLFGFKAKQDSLFEVFNLASHGVTQVKTIAEKVVSGMGVDAKIHYGTEARGWVGDVGYTWIDGGRLGNLGWKASFDSDGAVEQAIHDILSERGLLT